MLVVSVADLVMFSVFPRSILFITFMSFRPWHCCFISSFSLSVGILSATQSMIFAFSIA